jgi:hypothetical protein
VHRSRLHRSRPLREARLGRSLARSRLGVEFGFSSVIVPSSGSVGEHTAGGPREAPAGRSTSDNAHASVEGTAATREPRTLARRSLDRVRNSACRRATGGRAVHAGAGRSTCQGWSVVIASGPRTSHRRPLLGRGGIRRFCTTRAARHGLACSASLASWSSTPTAPTRRERVRCSTTPRAGPGASMAAWTPCSTVSAHRDAFVLVFNEDRSFAEAARLLGAPEGTVKWRCHYATRALRLPLPERGLVP